MLCNHQKADDRPKDREVRGVLTPALPLKRRGPRRSRPPPSPKGEGDFVIPLPGPLPKERGNFVSFLRGLGSRLLLLERCARERLPALLRHAAHHLPILLVVDRQPPVCALEALLHVGREVEG